MGMFFKDRDISEKVQEFDGTISAILGKIVPDLLEERAFLGLPNPERINTKPEIAQRQTPGSCLADEDFIRFNVFYFLVHGLDTSDQKAFYQVAKFTSKSEHILTKRLTLEGTLAAMIDPSALQGAAFDYLPQEGQAFYSSLRETVLSEIPELMKSMHKLMPKLIHQLQNGSFAESIEDVLRHELNHYAAPDKKEMGLLNKELQQRYKQQMLFVSGKESNIDWNDEINFYDRVMQYVIDGTADEESMAFFFTFIPRGKFCTESVNESAPNVHLAIDMYNPLIFVPQAIVHTITHKNYMRTRMKGTLAHPFGHEAWHILNKMYGMEGSYFPLSDANKTDVRLVQHILYDTLPAFQKRFLQAAEKSIERSQQYLLDRLSNKMC